LKDPRLPPLTWTKNVSGFSKSVTTPKIHRRQLSAKRGTLLLPPRLLANPSTLSMSRTKRWAIDASWSATTDHQTLAISSATANLNQPPALPSRHSFNDYRPRGPSFLLLLFLLLLKVVVVVVVVVVVCMTQKIYFWSYDFRLNHQVPILDPHVINL
jgi:hypothetical protein